MSAPLEANSLHHYLSATWGKIIQLCLVSQHRVASSPDEKQILSRPLGFLAFSPVWRTRRLRLFHKQSVPLDRHFGVLGGPASPRPESCPALLASLTKSSLLTPDWLVPGPCCQIPASDFSEGTKSPPFKLCGTDWPKTLAHSYKTLDISFLNISVWKMKSFALGLTIFISKVKKPSDISQLKYLPLLRGVEFWDLLPFPKSHVSVSPYVRF